MRGRLPDQTRGSIKKPRILPVWAIVLLTGAVIWAAAPVRWLAAQGAVEALQEKFLVEKTVAAPEQEHQIANIANVQGEFPVMAPGTFLLAEAAVVQQKPQVAESSAAPGPAGQAAQAPAKTPAAPANGAKDGAAKTSIRLFNTVEFRGALKNMPKWQRVVAAEERSRTFDGDVGKLMRASVYKQWVQLTEQTKGASVMEKAKAVNSFFNRWPYKTDQDVYKVADYWATPAEFMKRSGDCEDYAITKMYALIKLGVPPESMRIVALRDVIRNLAHAVLVVYTNNDAYVLDNLTNMVLTHKRYQHYNPQYSINGVYRWAHVRPKKKK